MVLGLQIVAGWTAFVVTFALVLLAWAVYSGQLDDADALNRIPLNEKEPEGWLGRPAKAKEV
jgi:nitrogen fixation-related uncharacterized protein